ncbi:ATP-binding protein [Paraferrimonas haliotis]|uniref:histidine kinase n=1 Tax=Paraferrimonas haliotis TaxID=2013866 RepID=A0AA37TM67_9GAMM|nr:ATP-binding protein [Paraferrimonas haliotis]GLS82103.1 two-component sensor histidine kinase [Paraferrimonas haliotis]
MAGLTLTRLVPNNLFAKLILCFWLISGLTIGSVLLVQQLVEPNPLQSISPMEQQVLDRVAQRIQSLPAGRIGERRFNREFDNHQRRPGEPRLILLNQQGESVTGQKVPRTVRHYLLIREDQELKQAFSYQFRHERVFGPQLIELGDRQLQLYGRVKVTAQKPWLHRLLEQKWLMLALALVLSGVIYGALAWHLSRGIRSLQRSAKCIANGDLSQRTARDVSERGDEIGQLAQAFDQMGEAVQSMLDNQRRLMSDISHELRTPLTRLQLALAIANKKGQDSKELNRMGYEAQQIEAMIQELLELSRANVSATESRQTLDINQVLAPIFSDAQFEASQHDIQLATQLIDVPSMLLEPKLIGRAVENVLRNAIRYAKSKVSVQQRIEQNTLIISIKDDGPGIDDDQLSQIFRPFYRPNEARDRDSGGAGLGLAISAAAITGHGGSIDASNREQGGLLVCIRLPIKGQ